MYVLHSLLKEAFLYLPLGHFPFRSFKVDFEVRRKSTRKY